MPSHTKENTLFYIYSYLQKNEHFVVPNGHFQFLIQYKSNKNQNLLRAFKSFVFVLFNEINTELYSNTLMN